MKPDDLTTIIANIRSQIPDKLNGAKIADIYVHLATELGLEHLLMPEARPDGDGMDHVPDKAPECYQDRLDRREKPHLFILRVYEPWHGKGLAMHHLLHLDRPLYFALQNWLLKNDWPDGLILPTKKQINDDALAHLGLKPGDDLPYPSYYKGLKKKLSLYNAARNRKG